MAQLAATGKKIPFQGAKNRYCSVNHPSYPFSAIQLSPSTRLAANIGAVVSNSPLRNTLACIKTAKMEQSVTETSKFGIAGPYAYKQISQDRDEFHGRISEQQARKPCIRTSKTVIAPFYTHHTHFSAKQLLP